MQEYVTEAIVLSKEPNGEADLRLSLFTKHFGKLVAKAKSGRKIKSKLSPHLEPGNVVRARFVRKNGLQVVDALKQGTVRSANLSDLYFLEKLLTEEAPEKNIWAILSQGTFSWRQALKALGWDPEHASCGFCGGKSELLFNLKEQDFFCDACLRKGPAKGDFRSANFIKIV